MKLSLIIASAFVAVANAQIYGAPVPPPPVGAYPIYGGGYGAPPPPVYGGGYGGGYGYAGPTPYQEPYLPADEEFGCGMYTWSKVYFNYRKPVPAIPDGSQSYLIRENFRQDHLAFITNNYECLCDAFSNPILNVCRQKTVDHYSTPSVYGTQVPGAGTVGPLPSKRMPFPPAQPDATTNFACRVDVEVYIPFTSPLPWEKHYDLTYEYEQDNFLECQCDTGGAPLMQTCRQIVNPVPPPPAPLPANPPAAARGG
jgi:hypothetical protein